jgi:hypothetical protein
MRHRHARPPARRRFLPPSLIMAGAAVGIAATGGASAFAGWVVQATAGPFTVHAARIPTMAPPTIRVRALPRIGWTAVEIAPGVPVQRYVVTRHLGPVNQVACDVPATAKPRCIDLHAPAGYQATYTIAATYGTQWTGEDSEPSNPVTMPGIALPLTIDGVVVLPGAAGAVIVPGAQPSSSPSLVAGTETAPSAASSPVSTAVSVPPLVTVPSSAQPTGGRETGPAPESTTPGAQPSQHPLPLLSVLPSRLPSVLQSRLASVLPSRLQ